jgi:hypothetical protein
MPCVVTGTLVHDSTGRKRLSMYDKLVLYSVASCKRRSHVEQMLGHVCFVYIRGLSMMIVVAVDWAVPRKSYMT